MEIDASSLLVLGVATLGGQVVSPDDWRCNGWWGDGGLRRYSWLFQGYCEGRFGQCFLDVIRGRGLTAHNWQCWRRDDGWWQADVSVTAGLAWQINNVIEEVTHSWRGCCPNARVAGVDVVSAGAEPATVPETET